ncbi:MAG: hypothetical protein HY548_00065 [Elusimicrobia bacterium]|nr:hypothetical protein [Elusimicrobiota bacterium]
MTRADYGAGTLSTRYSSAAAGEGLLFWFRLWGKQWGFLGSVLGMGALLGSFRKANRFSWGGPFIFLWVFTGPFFAFMARMKPGELSQAILEPAMMVPGLSAAAAIGLLLGCGFQKRKMIVAGSFAVLFIFIAVRGVPALMSNRQRGNYLAADYGTNLLRTLPIESVLLMISDEAVFSVEYQQLVAGRRPDVRTLVDAPLPWRWRQYRRRHPDLFLESQPDGGPFLVNFHAQRTPIFTEGIQADLMDALCPSGLAARARWPDRGPACLSEMENSLWMWDLYTRRVVPSVVLSKDYYSRALFRTVSSGAFNAGLLLGQAGRPEGSQRFYVRALLWNPDRMLRWREAF